MIVGGAEQLILRAFEQARDAGKPDWSRMTTGVLKNRMLGLTGREFREADYGAATFTEFVESYDDIVNLDRSTYPPIVELKQDAMTTLAPGGNVSMPRRARIRSDLWQAVIDRSSGRTYVWDLAEALARPGQPGDGYPILPTVDEDTDRQWRREFIGSLTPPPASAEERQMSDWSESLLPASRLPSQFIPLWNNFLSNHVHRLLLSWFEQENLEPPHDFVALVSNWTIRRASDTEELRQLVVRVVQEMTEQELAQLNLPPRAVLRATRSRRS